MKYKFIGAIACIAILLVGSLNWNLLVRSYNRKTRSSAFILCAKTKMRANP